VLMANFNSGTIEESPCHRPDKAGPGIRSRRTGESASAMPDVVDREGRRIIVSTPPAAPARRPRTAAACGRRRPRAR
jgi:hypothetical protein